VELIRKKEKERGENRKPPERGNTSEPETGGNLRSLTHLNCGAFLRVTESESLLGRSCALKGRKTETSAGGEGGTLSKGIAKRSNHIFGDLIASQKGKGAFPRRKFFYWRDRKH